jgi:hypothetical protein
VAGGQGPDAGNLEALAASHKKNQASLAEAGYNNTFTGSVLTHIPVARPCGARPARHHQLEKSVDRLLVNCF